MENHLFVKECGKLSKFTEQHRNTGEKKAKSIEDVGGEDPLRPIGRRPAGIHCQGGTVGHLIAHPDLVALSCFVQITHGKFLHRMDLVKAAGEQVIHPVHVAGIVHVTVPV